MESGGALDFRVLGPVEILRDGEVVSVGGPRQRALLALLLTRAGEAVRVDALVESSGPENRRTAPM